MIYREATVVLSKQLGNFPAVALLGPRQSGKTTLAKTFSNSYFDLELESEQLRLDIQWEAIIGGSIPVILDEAQHFPDIFPRIRSTIDSNRKRNGRFLILGSVSPGLMTQVSEFLTGRMALVELSPFSLSEIEPESAEDLWLMGGFPDGGILDRKLYPEWQTNYLDLLAMRDLPLWGLPATAQVTKRLFMMLAAMHGSLWNASQIGKSMGLSYHTVNTYLDYLEQAYLVRRLQPYFTNIRKRLVKSPKVFWRDSGLMHALMKVQSMDDLLVKPWVGASWEGWVIEQAIAQLKNHGIVFDPYFFRTSDGFEIDLVLVFGGKILAIETKLTANPGRDDLKRLEKAADLIKADHCVLVSKSKSTIEGKRSVITDVKGLVDCLVSA